MTDQEYKEKRAQLANLKQQLVLAAVAGKHIGAEGVKVAVSLEAGLYQELCRRCAEAQTC